VQSAPPPANKSPYLLRGNDKLPFNIAGARIVLPVILGWQDIAACNGNFISARRAAVNAWMRSDISRSISFIEVGIDRQLKMQRVLE